MDALLRPGARLAGRYEVRAKLGAGGMGVVYDVVDLASAEHVALKTLRAEVTDSQLIKREFRALADITHPNLVQLYDLFDADGQLCLTMELVAGVDLLTELRGDAHARATATLAGTRMAVHHADDTVPGPLPDDVAPPVWPPADLGRVRDRFAQLARGLRALHARGVVHRDIKPHNVRVTPDGRVVLLDFGLATATGALGALAGTLIYMAPEQTEGAVVAPAADWYSFGVLLYEALAGVPPWSGEAAVVLRHKRMDDPPSLRGRDGVPDDLAALADELLARDPATRPGALAVLERIGRRKAPRMPDPDTARELEHASDRGGDASPAAPITAVEAPRARADVMVGRTTELTQLLATWREVAAGGSAWVAIEAPSGLGKTLLVSALARDAIRGGHDGVREGTVLHGRCYEREAIAYKGIDQVVEALIARLVELGTPPSNAAAELAHPFPAAAQLAQGLAPAWHGHDLRGSAVRALVGELARDRPVLIALDDLHWADRDCLGLLAHAFAPPGIPGVMLAVTARPDAGARWQELPMPFARIRLEPLDERDAIELAQQLLGRAAVGVDGVALARASRGNPLELLERVRAAYGGVTSRGAAGELLVQRVAGAPRDVRILVELVATAGAPIPIAALAPVMTSALATSESVDEARVRAAIDRAQLAGLVRTQRSGRALVEAAHDHVREVVFAALPDATRIARAGQLATVLEQHHHEPAQVAALYLLAGQRDHARRCAQQAAERMSALGGHDTAAALWAQVAALSTGDGARAATLAEAEALASAGRGAEAAGIYQRLAHASHDAPARIRLLRRTAEELLRSGRIHEGLAVVDAVPDLREPGAGAITFARALALHARTRAGWLPHAHRRADRERLELQWAAIAGHTLGAPGAFMFAVERHLRAALASGDPEHVALAWSAEATLATFLDSRRFAEDCLHRAAAALAATPTDRARGVVTATAGLLQLAAGAWARADAVASTAGAHFDRVPHLVWERNTSLVINACARAHAGELTRLAASVRRDRERISATGDLYSLELAHTGFAVLSDLLADEPARATAKLETFSTRPTGVMTAWQRAIAHGLIGAYGDRPAWHRARVDELFSGGLLGLRLLRSPLVLGTALWTRATLELTAGEPGRAAPWIARLRALPMRGMTGLAELLTGHAALRAGDRPAARAHGVAAELSLVADAMPMFAASARWLHAPETWPSWRDALAKAGAIAPARLARVFAPAMPAE